MRPLLPLSAKRGDGRGYTLGDLLSGRVMCCTAQPPAPLVLFCFVLFSRQKTRLSSRKYDKVCGLAWCDGVARRKTKIDELKFSNFVARYINRTEEKSTEQRANLAGKERKGISSF